MSSSSTDASERGLELTEVLLVGGLSLALGGYVYVIGWALTAVRLAAVHLPVGYALPSVEGTALLATGARAVLVMAIVFVAMCAFAYFVHFGRWDQHAEEWNYIVAVNRTEARKRYLRRKALKRVPPRRLRLRRASRWQEALVRVIAGFNVTVLALALGLVGGRLLKTVIDQWQPGHWWALLAPWAVCSLVIARLLAIVSPLRGGRFAHTLLWSAVVGIAMFSSAPVGLLVLTWMGIGTLGRQFGARPLPSSTLAFLHSPLPWVLLTIYALVALSYSAMPPVSFSRAIVETAHGRTAGGYLGRTGSGVYLAYCTPLADATSTDDRVQQTPVSAIKSLTDTDFTLDTGYRPSLPTLTLHALGIDTQIPAWIRPELKERRPACAGTQPPRPSTGSETPQLGAGVYAATSPESDTGEQPIGQPVARRIAALAKRFEPTILTSISDPFWPVSVGAVLEDIGNDGRHTCVRHGARSAKCAPNAHATLSELRSSQGAPDDFLEYPIRPALTREPTPQLEAFLRGRQGREYPPPSQRQTLADPGLLDPWASARIYYLYAGPANRLHWPVPYPAAAESGLVALEYWFFYPYNYLPTVVHSSLIEDAPVAADVANTDLHQGDWEHVVVLVEPRSETARWLYTARHASEGKFLPWSSPMLTFDEGERPIVQAAYGGHPTYPAGCGAHPRYLKPINGHLSDWLVCGPGRFAFRGSPTPLIDLAATGWGCWKGHFGAPAPGVLQIAAQSTHAIVRTLARELQSYVLVPGPRSPLWQGENGHLQADDAEYQHTSDSGPCLAADGPTTAERDAERERILPIHQRPR